MGNTKPRVCLYWLDRAALVILMPSGVIYFNQTGGNFCLQSEAEGILFPINNEPRLGHLHDGSLDIRLAQATPEMIRISETTAQRIDTLLEEFLYNDIVKVDRSKLEQSNEAWIHVEIDEQSSGDLNDFAGYKAILTWPNSD
jgi:hypothetical protein